MLSSINFKKFKTLKKKKCFSFKRAIVNLGSLFQLQNFKY